MMPLLRFLLSFFLSLAAISTNTTHAQPQRQIPNLEIQALMSFKLSLDDPLGALNGWDSSTPAAPCDWRGIQCSAAGRVSELRLPRLRLSGPITDRIADLRELRKLSLRSNLLNGTIPAAITALSRLRAVFLQSNELSGSPPPQIANLTGLQVLNLAQNRLSGRVARLPPNLRYLDLSSNDFACSIPGNLSSCLDADRRERRREIESQVDGEGSISMQRARSCLEQEASDLDLRLDGALDWMRRRRELDISIGRLDGALDWMQSRRELQSFRSRSPSGWRARLDAEEERASFAPGERI